MSIILWILLAPFVLAAGLVLATFVIGMIVLILMSAISGALFGRGK